MEKLKEEFYEATIAILDNLNSNPNEIDKMNLHNLISVSSESISFGREELKQLVLDFFKHQIQILLNENKTKFNQNVEEKLNLLFDSANTFSKINNILNVYNKEFKQLNQIYINLKK